MHMFPSPSNFVDKINGLTHPQLLEGLKEESQVQDNGKGEGVGARSLTRNTRG
jgi:hypothetical protein